MAASKVNLDLAVEGWMFQPDSRQCQSAPESCWTTWSPGHRLATCICSSCPDFSPSVTVPMLLNSFENPNNFQTWPWNRLYVLCLYLEIPTEFPSRSGVTHTTVHPTLQFPTRLGHPSQPFFPYATRTPYNQCRPNFYYYYDGCTSKSGRMRLTSSPALIGLIKTAQTTDVRLPLQSQYEGLYTQSLRIISTALLRMSFCVCQSAC